MTSPVNHPLSQQIAETHKVSVKCFRGGKANGKTYVYWSLGQPLTREKNKSVTQADLKHTLSRDTSKAVRRLNQCFLDYLEVSSKGTHLVVRRIQTRGAHCRQN